jgi:hypothetical protein
MFKTEETKKWQLGEVYENDLFLWITSKELREILRF